MKKFIMDKDFTDLFPQAKIGILVCEGIDGKVKDENRYMPYLAEAMQACKKHIANLEFTANPVIATWREAFRKFKTKKGARCSIEAMLKRVFNGNEIGSIIPLVDIYNGISLTYGVPIGGEDIDKFDGDVHLTLANGSEEFVTYGSDKSEPPYPGEVVYKDNAGAICRCWNWRESVRTMLTEETTNALMIIETVGGEEADAVLEEALDALAQAAQLENETKEDIGARRLHTLFEKMLEDISFNAGADMPDVDVTINGDYVAEHLGGDGKKLDMRQYIL